MSKFHINKKGIPAPCRAESKPCPLGGSEVHFQTEKEAQAYVDRENKKQFGMLGVISSEPGIFEAEVSKESFEKVFKKPFKSGQGFDVSWVTDFQQYDDVNLREHLKEKNPEAYEVFNSLPEDVQESIANEEDSIMLISEDNIENYIKMRLNPEILRPWASSDPEARSELEFHYKMVDTALENFEFAVNKKLVFKKLGNNEFKRYETLDPYFVERISRFAKDKMLEESKVEMNGKKIIVVGPPDLPSSQNVERRNWIAEYAELVNARQGGYSSFDKSKGY